MARTSGGRWAYLAEIERQKAETERHRDQYGSRGALKALGGTILDLGKTLGVEYAKYKFGGEQKADLDVAKTVTEGRKAGRLKAGTDIITDLRGEGFDPTNLSRFPRGTAVSLGGKTELGATFGRKHAPAKKGGSPGDPKYHQKYDALVKEQTRLEGQREKLIKERKGAPSKVLDNRIASLDKRIARNAKAVYSMGVKAGIPLTPAGGGAAPSAREPLTPEGLSSADALFRTIAASTNLGGKDFTPAERTASIRYITSSDAFAKGMETWATDLSKTEEDRQKYLKAILVYASRDPRKAIALMNDMGLGHVVNSELDAFGATISDQRRRHVGPVPTVIGAVPRVDDKADAQRRLDAWIEGNRRATGTK